MSVSSWIAFPRADVLLEFYSALCLLCTPQTNVKYHLSLSESVGPVLVLDIWPVPDIPQAPFWGLGVIRFPQAIRQLS